MRVLAATCLLAALAACTTVTPVQRKVDPDTLPSCTRACEQVGMRLSAIVFVSEFGGCVCEPAPRAGLPGGSASGAAAGGLVTILAAEAAQQQQQQQSSAGTGSRR